MKKYLLYLPVAMALLGMASCSQDRDPKYHAPTPGSFVLNKPAMMDQEIVLTNGQTLEFSCSQPDYGFAASASYSMEMALNQDFTEFYSLTPRDENSTIISVNQSEVASGYCELMGITSEDDYTSQYPDGFPVSTIYFRAVCQLPGYESSIITSNVVSYNYLKPYFAVPVPGYIYLVGAPSGWKEPSEGNAAAYADWRLFEPNDAIGSKIYTGVFDIPAGDDAMFRFYTALTGWDNDSYGVQEPDEAVQFPEFDGGTFEHALVKGKGAFWFPNWPGGEMTMVVNMSDASNMTVTFTAGAVEVFVPSYIYMVGGYNDWAGPNEGNKNKLFALPNSQNAPDIYTGTYPVGPGDFWFRFATALDEGDGWGPTIGWQEPDEGATFDFTNNHFEGTFVNPGSGSWCFNMPSDGNFNMVVNFANNTVEYTFEPEE